MSAGRVLVLDDEAQIRRVLRTSLVASGFVVREARRGEEALEMIREELPDLLIIDINLPGMSGFEVCREIREVLRRPDHHALGAQQRTRQGAGARFRR